MGNTGEQKRSKTRMRMKDGEEAGGDVMCCQRSTERELRRSWKASPLAHRC